MTSIAPRAVIFDWDNTLVDSWQTIHDALNETLAALDRPLWTLSETKARTRQSLRDAFPALFGDDWTRAQKIYLERFAAIHLERLRPFEGARELLAELQRHGVFLALVSNKTGRLLRHEVEALGWADYFGAIIGAGDAAFDKPHRAPVDLALADSGIAAGLSVWFVGDTGIDIDCAVNAGCVPILLQHEREAETDDATLAPPHLRLGDFAGLGAAILPSMACNLL